ncbi:MAG TPA: Crp/Fnr family transcriptional regulator, partial [Puia sp.]|nr:Crp/Fnr family transcriptional regulator [Puia sp.]
SLKKGDDILKIGQVCHHVSYIQSGLTMHYFLHDGIEIPVDFQGEGEWVSYLKSFMSRTISDMGIKTLEDTKLFRLSADNFQKLIDLDPGKVMKLKNFYTEQSFIKNTQHSADMAMLGAKERYQKFVNENPSLHNRIPQYYIAAYLGIKPQSLSRIRKEG